MGTNITTSKTRLHKTWTNIKRRCSDKNNDNFMYYGGRGISVCDEWKNDFRKFAEWAMENGYDDSLYIDRIDNDGNYEPNNCQFVTHKENCGVGKRRRMKNNTTGYIGVYLHKESGKYTAMIQVDKKLHYLGIRDTLEEALELRRQAEIKFFGKVLTENLNKL